MKTIIILMKMVSNNQMKIVDINSIMMKKQEIKFNMMKIMDWKPMKK